MTSIRAGKGLGDNLYLQAIVAHLLRSGMSLEVCSNWPSLFSQLRGDFKVVPFRRDRIDRVAHYSTRKNVDETDQFEDCCITARVDKTIPLRMEWAPLNQDLVDGVRSAAGSRPVVLVQMPRHPMDRKDGYGIELLPQFDALQRAASHLSERAFLVQIGKGERIYDPLAGIHLDLSNKTSLTDIFDLATHADAFFGYCSFIIPLAESFGKHELLVWSRRGLNSRNPYIRTITPRKIVHRKDLLQAVMDDCDEAELVRAIDALLGQTASPLPV